MSISIAQSRQQLSSLIAAAQQAPQIITKRNAPVAVLVSAEYFKRSEAAVKSERDSFYGQLLALREAYAPKDNAGLEVKDTPKIKPKTKRQAAWARANAFTQPD
jgi:prevent-host-death family protein